jgi:NitT/TauT family transport system permease protein
MATQKSTIPAADVLMPRPRAEFECELADASGIGDVQRKLPMWERLANNDGARRLAVLAGFLLVWEGYALWVDNSLLFPRFTETFSIFMHDLLDGRLIDRTLTSMQPLLIGYAGGIVLAAVLTTLAVSSRIGADLLSTLTAMFNPLPAIAVLPLALIWFGLGLPSLVFVIVHSVLWAVALNTLTGFRSVPATLRLSGKNYGLGGVRYVALLLIPAAFPAILAGLKIGWAFAWRTLIAAELVFGVSSRSGGLGWYIFEARSELDTARVFAGLFAVILIGLFVESVIFRAIEYRTVQRWGMEK